MEAPEEIKRSMYFSFDVSLAGSNPTGSSKRKLVANLEVIMEKHNCDRK